MSALFAVSVALSTSTAVAETVDYHVQHFGRITLPPFFRRDNLCFARESMMHLGGHPASTQSALCPNLTVFRARAEWSFVTSLRMMHSDRVVHQPFGLTVRYADAAHRKL